MVRLAGFELCAPPLVLARTPERFNAIGYIYLALRKATAEVTDALRGFWKHVAEGQLRLVSPVAQGGPAARIGLRGLRRWGERGRNGSHSSEAVAVDKATRW